MDVRSQNVTELLLAWGAGDEAAREKLSSLVYEELRRMARQYMAAERSNHILQPTALVHEAYLRLVDVKNVRWRNRAHFFAIAARLMRNILVDFARSQSRLKRGGRSCSVSLEEGPEFGQTPEVNVVAVDDALFALARLDPRKSRVVELRFFGGLSIRETAEVLDVSSDTVMREWKVAKLWLLRELSGGRSPDKHRGPNFPTGGGVSQVGR